MESHDYFYKKQKWEAQFGNKISVPTSVMNHIKKLALKAGENLNGSYREDILEHLTQQGGLGHHLSTAAGGIGSNIIFFFFFM